VICVRYEKQLSTIITSNKAFAEWGQVFAGDPIMVTRLPHLCARDLFPAM
jgi:DNA replication protein DnaC